MGNQWLHKKDLDTTKIEKKNKTKALMWYILFPGRQHPEDSGDQRITDYVSYYDGQTQRRSNINDPLTDLERTYHQLQEQQHEQHTDHRYVITSPP